MRLKQLSVNVVDKRIVAVRFGEQELVLSGCGAMYWPAQKMLVIADLHLEKGSYFASRGNPLPLYDSINTLRNIEEAIHYFKPRYLLSLGDNVHDKRAFDRMPVEVSGLLSSIIQQVEQWIWLKGNHDDDCLPNSAEQLVFTDFLDIGGITFSHEVMQKKSWQIVGHFHPKAKLNSVKGKCFVQTKNILYMPAFGYYTGGLDIESEAFKRIINSDNYAVFISYRKKIWKIK